MVVDTAGETPFTSLAHQMSKMVDQMQKGFFSFCPAETWTPSVNLYENDVAYVMCVDLGGMAKEQIDLSVVEGQLQLKGMRAVPAPPDADPKNVRMRVHLMEIDHGAFCRNVQLPEDAMTDNIAANYRNGMLWVEIPKRGVP